MSVSFEEVVFTCADELKGRLRLDAMQIKALFDQTIGQASSDLWLKVRQGRITASKFSKVIHATKPGSVVNYCMGSSKPFTSIAMQWGVDHEKLAVSDYEKKTGNIVKPAGFCSSRCGRFGGSPDGCIPEQRKLIEVKCPYSYRDCTNFSEVVNSGNWYLKKDKRGKIVFNLSHSQGRDYFHQIQACMHFMKADTCDFVVWSPHDLLVVTFNRSEYWKAAHMSRMGSVWNETILHHIISNQIPVVSVTCSCF